MNKFSVVIPTYNRIDFVKKAIDSVLGQSYQNFELIVVDDGSTDETYKLKDLYGDKLKWITSKNLGVSSARNLGIESSNNEWICFLDSDDQWLPNKLELQNNFIVVNPEYKIVHGEEVWIRNGKRVNPKLKHQKGGQDQFFTSLKLCLISPSTVCIHRDLLEEFNGFNPEYIVCEDYELWLKITHKYNIGYIEENLINKYGGHEDQLSQKFRAMDYYRIRAMHELANNYSLSSAQLSELKSELVKKSEILLKGYRKHNNLENYEFVSECLIWASARA